MEQRQDRDAKVDADEWSLPADARTEGIIFRLSTKKNTVAGEAAKQVWDLLQRRKREWEEQGARRTELVVTEELKKSITKQRWQAFLYEMEDERIRLGEKTPRVQEFLDSRRQLNRSLLHLKERFQTEAINATSELMPNEKKETSIMHHEFSAIVADLRLELGFSRIPEVEISREDSFNAFVLQVAKEGEETAEKSDIPLRVFVHAGFLTRAKALLEKQGESLKQGSYCFLAWTRTTTLKAAWLPD